MKEIPVGTKVKFVRCQNGCSFCLGPDFTQTWWRRGFLVILDTNGSSSGAPYTVEEWVEPKLVFPTSHIEVRTWKEGDAPTVAPLGSPTLEFTVDDEFKEPKRCFLHGNHLKIV